MLKLGCCLPPPIKISGDAPVIPGPIFPSYLSALHPGTPERGCNTGAFPSAL